MHPTKSTRHYGRATRSLFAWARLPWANKRSGKARTRAAKIIDQSGLFDRTWYLAKYVDVARQGLDPTRHYLEFGWREGRDPGPHFSTDAYLRANPDVSRAGLNPLLHYLDFGRSEGRGAFEHRSHSVPVTSPGEPFGVAAPCVAFRLPEAEPTRWRRTFQLDRDSRDLLSAGGNSIGYARGSRKRITDEAFAHLAELSGYPLSKVAAKVSSEPAKDPDCALVDAWYISRNQLRTRWAGPTGAAVIRAYQHDPNLDGSLALVAEGLAGTSLDLLDVSLRNPYFPVLFVRSLSDGDIVASALLEFPSLCRGGAHYSELVSTGRDDHVDEFSLDIAETSRRIADDLLAINRQEVSALIGELAVDLAGADGTHPLFQPDFQIWLSRVVQIPITVEHGEGDPLLIAALCSSRQSPKRQSGGRLTLAADMVPSLCAISAAASPEDAPVSTILPLIVSDADPSQPATLFRPPITELRALKSGTQYFSSTWPHLTSGHGKSAVGSVAVAAIRQMTQRELAGSELLVPLSADLVFDREPKTITWLIWPEDWEEADLGSALEALSTSADTASHSIAFVGNPGPLIRPIADRLFDNRTGVFTDLQKAADEFDNQLVGYLGSGIILHDQRTSKFLSALLDEPSVSTTSCVVVGVEDRAKGSHVGIRDGGDILAGPDRETRKINELEMRGIWRSAYPVARPPRDFWIAHSSDVARWISGDDRHGDGTHVCTSLVTVSTSSAPETEARVQPPSAIEALRLRTLHG